MSSKRSLDFPISDSGSEQSGAEMSTTLETEGANQKPVSSEVEIKIYYANWREKQQKEREQLLSRLSPFGLGIGAVVELLYTWRQNRKFAEDALQFYNETKVKTAMTMTEEILARSSEKPHSSPGHLDDSCYLRPKFLMNREFLRIKS